MPHEDSGRPWGLDPPGGSHEPRPVRIPLPIPDLSDSATSARMRGILTTCTWWPSYDNIVREAWDKYLRAIGPALGEWIDHSAAATLRTTHQVMVTKRLLRNGRILDQNVARAAADPEGPRRVQACIRDFLHKRGTPLESNQILAKRWSRWFPPGLAFPHAKRSLGNLTSLTGRVPLCVLHAVLLSWFNGWTTSRRFQVIPPLGCRFGHHCGGRDDIEHYAVCLELWDNFPAWTGLRFESLSLEKFLLAGREDPNPLIKSAVAVSAALGAFHLAKAKNTKYRNEELRAILSERIQMVRVYSRTVRRAVPR